MRDGCFAAVRTHALYCSDECAGRASRFRWDDRTSTALLHLWHDGVSANQIGVLLGCGKNAVIGRAHRIGLHRPSPLKPGPEAAQPKPPKPKRDPRAARPPMPQPERVPTLAQWRGAQAVETARLVSLGKRPPVPLTVPPRPATGPVTGPVGTVRSCQWIDGEKPDWTMCGQPAVPGYSWCIEHKRRAFVRGSSQWESAA
jgi:GcrA cell cycle regulator